MKKILCIDGGGMRGYLPCALLVELERRAGRPCCELFDLIAGTSIGGIVGALLAAGVPAAKAMEFFTVDGPDIFRRRWWHYFGLTGPRYSGSTISRVLAKRLEFRPVKTHLLIPALDLVAQEPYFFKFAPPHPGPLPPGGEGVKLWQACRATSAAQTYFPAYRTRFAGDPVEHVFWDGGNVANNPSVCAYAEAEKLWPRQPVKMLSLGCGAPMVALAADSMVNANALRVAAATVELLFAAGSEDVDYQMAQLLGIHYVRVQPELVRSLPLDGAREGDLLNLKAVAADLLRMQGGRLDGFAAVKTPAIKKRG